jgi:hypothetical protein
VKREIAIRSQSLAGELLVTVDLVLRNFTISDIEDRENEGEPPQKFASHEIPTHSEG